MEKTIYSFPEDLFCDVRIEHVYRSLIRIEMGKLAGRLHSTVTAAEPAEKVTGNALATGFEFKPIVRMTCTFIEAGTHSKEQLISEIKEGILVTIASGGDFTADGNYASPVQVAYLTDGENLLGRLPELTISGSVFDFFGKNFIGLAADKYFLAGNERLAVTRLKTSKL
jgi:predicted Zn-dependent protease